AWMESSSDYDQEMNTNMVFMAKMEKVHSDSDKSSSSAEETIVESKSKSKYETSEYYDNSTYYGLFVNDNDDQEVFHDAIEYASENFIENHIDSQKDYDKYEVDHNDSEEKDHLVDKLIQKRIEKAYQQTKDLKIQNKDLQDKYDVLINQVNNFKEQNNEFNEQMKVLNEKNADLLTQTLQEKILEKETKILELEGCVSDKDLQIEKCLERLNDCENKLHKIRQMNQTIHMIVPFKDNVYNGRKGIGFENPSYFEKAKDLRPSLYDEKVIGLGYTSMFLTHSDEALEIKKFKKARENKIEFAYDYGNLNASYIVQICLWVIDSGCSKHMTRNRALLMNFVEKFLGTVRFGNNDFVVIAGYGVVGLEVAFRKSTCFVRTEDGVDLLTGDRSSNLYTVSLNEVASNSSAYLLANANSSQSWLWNQRLSHLNFATINNHVKNNLVQGLPKMKFKKDHLCSACEQGKIHQKYHKSKMAFASNKPLYLLHMDLCGSMHVKSINGKRYVSAVVDDYSRTSQQNGVMKRRNQTLVKAARTMLTFANLPLFLWAEAIATACFTQNRSIIDKHFNKTPYELMNKRKPNIKFFYMFGCRCYLLNDYDDVGKIKAKGNIGVFVGYSKEFVAFRIYNKLTQEVVVPSSNTQSFSNNMVPNVDEASTSHNVFNECLEDAYFDASTSFHESSNVHTFYQPYPYEKKGTKDHPLHKIIGDPKSSVRTRGHLANSCLLSFIEPINVAEALRDANWDFTVFKMDVKTAYLNEILKEEVYVGQPLGFVSTQYPDHVYALDKALYGLKQVPQAWYNVLSQFQIDSGFQKVPTPMVEQAKLKLDLVRKPVNHTDYRSMIGSLMYVTLSRPDIMFTTCLWYPKDSGFDLTAYSNADHVGCHLDRKTRTLSYRGRLTLLKSALGALGTYFFSIYKAPKYVVNYLEKVRCNFFCGGSLDNKKIPWIAWKKLCSLKSCGGLGVGSFNALNLDMISKLWWRFHLEKNSLWRRVITSIHVPLGGLDVENPTVIQSCLSP
nr:Gag-Pol polyprotein [Tanacetum cinerariifolium]